LKLGAHGDERADDRPELVVLDEYSNRHFPSVARPLEEGIERKLEVFEVLEAQVEPRCKTAEHEVSDAVERVVRRQRQADLVSRHRLPPSPIPP